MSILCSFEFKPGHIIRNIDKLISNVGEEYKLFIRSDRVIFQFKRDTKMVKFEINKDVCSLSWDEKIPISERNIAILLKCEIMAIVLRDTKKDIPISFRFRCGDSGPLSEQSRYKMITSNQSLGKETGISNNTVDRAMGDEDEFDIKNMIKITSDASKEVIVKTKPIMNCDNPNIHVYSSYILLNGDSKTSSSTAQIGQLGEEEEKEKITAKIDSFGTLLKSLCSVYDKALISFYFSEEKGVNKFVIVAHASYLGKIYLVFTFKK